MSTGQLPTSLRVSSALLRLDLARHGPDVVIGVRGEMDLSTVHLLDELVEQVARERPSRVVLDLAGVTFFCADGVRALLRAQATVVAAGGQLLLRSPSPRTRLVLAITGDEHLFPSADDITATG